MLFSRLRIQEPNFRDEVTFKFFFFVPKSVKIFLKAVFLNRQLFFNINNIFIRYMYIIWV